jgi:hypothetical protein
VKTLIHRGKIALAHKLKAREEVATFVAGQKSRPILGTLSELHLV